MLKGIGETSHFLKQECRTRLLSVCILGDSFFWIKGHLYRFYLCDILGH